MTLTATNAAAKEPSRAIVDVASMREKPTVFLIVFAWLSSGAGSVAANSEQSLASPIAQITRERLLNADAAEPGSWLTAGRDWRQSYYSPLIEINKGNIGRLGYAWSYDLKIDTSLAATPIVVDGVMFASGNGGKVYALDARTGALHWTFNPKIDPQVDNCCGGINRGVAVWGGKVYVAALDAQLYALEAATGAVVWRTDTVLDHTRAYSSTGAPYIAGDRVIIGNSGGEYDTRGYVSAYDPETGRLVWRFYTVPGDPSKGFENPHLRKAAKTWRPNSLWQLGLGGNAWDGMAYDPQLHLLYVGTGNGLPWDRVLRSPGGGDQLFVSSILAINADTGRLAWYYQTTPAESWDYDATQKPILADITFNGMPRKVLLQANKNGFFYVLDRKTGRLLSAKPFVYINWASHVDLKTGRPAETGKTDYSNGPKLIFPTNSGGHNWQPMAFNPHTGLVYIPALEAGEVHGKAPGPFTIQKRTWNIGVEIHSLHDWKDKECSDIPAGWPSADELRAGEPDPSSRTFLRAWDPALEKVVWQVETTGSGPIDGARGLSGTMTTASDLVFQGDIGGHLRVFDAKNGTQLGSIDVGTSIVAAPMTYTIDGEQYVAVMAGAAITEHYPHDGRIVALRLDGGSVPQRRHEVEAVDLPTAPSEPDTASPADLARGKQLFQRICGSCHVSTRRAPDLTKMTRSTNDEFFSIVRQGSRANRGMPNFSEVLSEQDAKSIHGYIIHFSWKQYRCNSKWTGAQPESGSKKR